MVNERISGKFKRFVEKINLIKLPLRPQKLYTMWTVLFVFIRNYELIQEFK